ncbi:MAG: DNA alkylation repair protein [Cyanobacteria bacterium]|nr:DNA alkylation repair protein [Cyanobacteriota bacterium]
MTKLESLGTEQTRKTWRRHGSGDNIFGVLIADLKTLAKSIKRDHKLACQLWDTENVDARSLATMILDPKELDEKTAYKWISDLNYYALASLLAGCLAQSNFAHKVINEWIDSKNVHIQQSGYDTRACFLKNDESLSKQDCQYFLDKIEKEIHDAPNRVRYSMNSALIAIGIYKTDLSETALKCADRIGVVEVDHGDTSCKTPDARSYIIKT